MENLSPILAEIVQLTTVIETKYPELYRLLDENPMTLPTNSEKAIDMETMQDYLQSLKELLKTYPKTHNT